MNDCKSPYFVNTDYSYFSSASNRTDQGYKWAKEHYEELTKGMSKDEAFNLVSHSMGGAFSKGVEKYLKKKGWEIKNNVMINTFQVDKIKNEPNNGTNDIDYQNTNDPVLFWFDINLGKGKLNNAEKTIRENAKNSKTPFIHRSPIDGGRKFWDNLQDKANSTKQKENEKC